MARLDERAVPNAHGPAGRPIVFTTDFGLSDPYAGVMKGVVLGINPRATMVDLTHQIQPQNVRQAAFVLGTSYRFFPAEAIHVVVVDPGVGTGRRAVLLATPAGRFLAPDNGVLSHVLGDYLDDPPERPGRVDVPFALAAYNLTSSRYWLHSVSQTFHGRDIFAPAAAHLSLGVRPGELGEPVSDLVWLPAPRPAYEGHRIQGEVVNVDHFGNLVSNVPSGALAGDGGIEVTIKGRRIAGLSRTYQEGEQTLEGGLAALVGSHGYLEIAVRNGSAALALGADVGEPVHITRCTLS